MSDPVRIALVAEGPTDRIVIEAAIRSMLGERPFVLRQLQPEESVAFGPLGTGWGGVYRWCKDSARRGHGRLSGDALVSIGYDMLVLHLDADVADEVYPNARIDPGPPDRQLPCAKPCPPASATTDALRTVLLSWCGEVAEPTHVVICMPSKSLVTWVVAAAFPTDQMMQRNHPECFANPEGRLLQQPMGRRFRKRPRDYQDRADLFVRAWPDICRFDEAARFQREFVAARPP